jgi:hypothetical protein
MLMHGVDSAVARRIRDRRQFRGQSSSPASERAAPCTDPDKRPSIRGSTRAYSPQLALGAHLGQALVYCLQTPGAEGLDSVRASRIHATKVRNVSKVGSQISFLVVSTIPSPIRCCSDATATANTSKGCQSIMNA